MKPPGFDPEKSYPMILEIRGGPHSAYGPNYSTEAQLYAAAGYVVFYTNPRGSTSYGEEFANTIDLAYPGYDYDDLMSGVNALIERGYIDSDQVRGFGNVNWRLSNRWALHSGVMYEYEEGGTDLLLPLCLALLLDESVRPRISSNADA